jgi:hypothetical protein
MDTISDTFGLGYDFSHIVPVPHDPDSTEYVAAGAVTLGLEYRSLDADTRVETFDESGNLVVKAVAMVETGLSIHVFDTETMGERLRFDDLDEDPHYHYLAPGTRNLLVVYDRNANGDMMTWATGVLRQNLPAMLRHAGADDLADQVDNAVLAPALDALERMIQSKVAERQGSAG